MATCCVLSAANRHMLGASHACQKHHQQQQQQQHASPRPHLTWKLRMPLGSCQVALGVNQPKPVMSSRAAGQRATSPPASTLSMLLLSARKATSTTCELCWRYSACAGRWGGGMV